MIAVAVVAWLVGFAYVLGALTDDFERYGWAERAYATLILFVIWPLLAALTVLELTFPGRWPWSRL